MRDFTQVDPKIVKATDPPPTLDAMIVSFEEAIMGMKKVAHIYPMPKIVEQHHCEQLVGNWSRHFARGYVDYAWETAKKRAEVK